MMRVGSIARRVVSPLQFLIILQLKRESKYGYQMLKTLKEEFEGIWELKTGTFYPAIRSLETRGFVKTELKEGKEFYSLTEKGDTLLMKLGERFEHEYKIGFRYFQSIIKWMPSELKKKALIIMKKLSEENLDITSHLNQLFDDIDDDEMKLEILENQKKFLETRLKAVDKLHNDIIGVTNL